MNWLAAALARLNRESLAKDNMSERRNPGAMEKSESFEARSECLSESKLKNQQKPCPNRTILSIASS